MIETVERALIVWGDQYRRCLHGLGIPSQLGAVIDGGGMIVRGTAPGSVPLCGDELGVTGEAVESALVQVRMHHTRGEELLRLARMRYLTDPMPLVRQQVKRMRYGSEDVYHNRLATLHQALEPQLQSALPWFRRGAA